MSAPETIDLPHGEAETLETAKGFLRVGPLKVAPDETALLVASHREGRAIFVRLTPAERRWLAAELLFGLEEEQEQRAPTPWIGRREEQRAMHEPTTGLSEAERERYADIVLGYLDGDNTLDPLDAGHIASDVIAAYREDQQARLDAMQRVVSYVRLRRQICYSDQPFNELLDFADHAAAILDMISESDLDALDQEARDANE
jgi:hypothetical protein